MAAFSAAENPAIAASLDFTRFAWIVDVGGGRGGFRTEVLARNPRSTGILLERPEVLADPAATAGRWAGAPGDFFSAVPANADAYVLKRILHDRSDDDAVRILRTCRRAMTPAAQLFVVDAVLPSGDGPHPGKLMDVVMMVIARGRERTRDEFAALFDRSGLRLVAVHPTPTALSAVEAQPV